MDKVQIRKNIIISCIIVFGIVPLVINILFKFEAPLEILRAEKSAGDMLSYISGAMAFVGTTFLGWIAYKQNEYLKRIEENNFIAHHACIDLLSSISMKELDKIAVYLDEEHAEQIVEEKEIVGSNYQSFKIKIAMDRMGNIPALVHVSEIVIWLGNSGNKVRQSICFFAYAYDDYFSKVAISKEKDFFEITVLLRQETKAELLKCLEMEGTLMIELDMEFVSPSYVITKMKNRATFTNSNEIKTDFELTDTKPLSFWEGSNMVSKKDIKCRLENK